MEKSTGVVTWYSAERGFGFITPDHGGENVFVHKSRILGGGHLERNQLVEYELVKYRGRLIAANVAVRQ